METDKAINSALFRPEQERIFKYITNSAFMAAKEISHGFVVDDVLKPIMRALGLYFCHDSRFEEEGFGSLQKGIFLCGSVGTGKTTLMKAFINRKNPKTSYSIISSMQCRQAFLLHGIEGLERFFGQKNMYGTIESFCFDDVGAENIISKHMGNELNVMEEIIINRYQNNAPFCLTHFTSNLDAGQIEKLYGTRVRSRLREMCNFLVMDGNDRRK